MTDLRQYYKKLLLFSLLLLAGSLVFARIAGKWLVSDVYYLFAPFFAAAFTLTAYVHHKGMQQKAKAFTQLFVGVTMSRLFFFLLILVAYSIPFRDDAVRFIIWFLLFYLLYTVFEMVSLFRSVRKRE